MSPLQRRHGLAVLTRVRSHVDAGDLPGAQELLSEILAEIPADPRKARPAEAEAVVLQTGVLLSLGEPHAARGWAAYGHTCLRRLYGDRDRRTLHSLGLLAAVLTRVGAHSRAVQRYQELIELFSELDGPQSERALAAQADLATVEHARGQCQAGRARLSMVIQQHQQVFGTRHPVGIRMIARLAAMWRDCGEVDHAQALLTQARAFATGLPPEIHDLLSAVETAPPAEAHVCSGQPLPEVPLPPAVLKVPGPIDEDTLLMPVAESPFGRPFSTLSYLPAHPELVAWEPSPRTDDDAPEPSWRLSPATMALVAAIIGIVAITVLFLLLVSAAKTS
ncbi:tetratricopeptide repeat protein [Catelliglobosispora koreensis]|uniref:tetratricopeptide repeat protein n=1 Tax=Catelliglobosispora koreensis TaxID=129052 RepID=UPI0003802F9E|nr:tetratricopeptide repeat protein [Catelliglobosispora koreensis]